MLADGLKPDVISSDIHQMAIQGPMFDLPTTLSKFLTLGMPLHEVVACATVNAARAIGLDEAGTLAIGAPADVALFRVEEGDYWYYDIGMDERPGSQMLVNTLTLVNGEELPRMEERPLHFWATIPEAQRAATSPGSRAARTAAPAS
jgi:dihydroorotase